MVRPRSYAEVCCIIGCIITVAPAVVGCAIKTNDSPLASIWRVRNEMENEMSDAIQDAGARISKTWSDMLHDWNYVDEDAFGDIRNAAGHE